MVTAPETRPGSPATAVSGQPSCQLGREQLSGPNSAVNPLMQLACVGHYAGALYRRTNHY
jgi:hypothetical protein